MLTDHNQAPDFAMWKTVARDKAIGWERYWFSENNTPNSDSFRINALGIDEPMFNENVTRPVGSGDWLFMFFHLPAKLREKCGTSKTEFILSQKNTLIVWPPGAPQFYSWGKQANVEPHSWMHCNGSYIVQLMEHYQFPVNCPIAIHNKTLINEGLALFRDEMLHPRSNHDVLACLFNTWVLRLNRELNQPYVIAEMPTFVYQIKQYLDEHFTEKIDLSTLCSEVVFSKSHVCNQFKKYIGCTIQDYILKKRIELAKRMLCDSTIRINQIAEKVGYSDIFQFSKKFKKVMNSSPSKYRDHIYSNNA